MAKKLNRPEFLAVNEDDLKPAHRWQRPLQAPGTTQVDFEERVDFRRLHRYRLARTREALAKSGMGAMLSFDQSNIRYISSTVIGEWARDKLIRYCLLTGTGDPWVGDFGSAARHHRIYCPWLHEDHIRAGNPGMRGAIGPEVGLFKQAAKEIKDLLEQEGVADMPLGLDVCEPPMLFALQEQGIEVRDGQQMMLAAREIKSHDEITLLNIASSMVDGVYQDIAAELLPKASDIGFESEMAAFGLNFCHGLGLGLHERPLISRLNSFIEPYELKAGMVFAVETFCPATDGISAARIEEMVVLTPEGAKIISLYPAKELPIANRY